MSSTVDPDRSKGIPKVDRLLAWPEMIALLTIHPRPEVLRAVRLVLSDVRERLLSGKTEAADTRASLVASIRSQLEQRSTNSLRRIINGTGVVVHTNLGRSPLAEQAEQALLGICGTYCNLEYDLDIGQRGRRNAHVEGLICELTGAEAALVVNNNAAAVILALSALAAGREVIVSRGELVEIGGSFRIPDVMRQSGARLIEVGTTNRTHPRDYESAIADSTALFLKVHTSNFAIVGFTSDTSVEQLAALGSRTGIPVMLDAGSGCLIDLTPYGIGGEATIAQYLNQGADLVTFSGDKLLGGPQAGIIAGKRDLVESMKQHPLLRAVRMDKLSLAALEATLRLYRDPQRALLEIPTLRMLTVSGAELAKRADRIVRRIRRGLPSGITVRKQAGESSVGGGAFPLLHLATTLIEVAVPGHSPQQIEAILRRTASPVIGRIHRDRFLLDVRTIPDRDLPALSAALAEAAQLLAREKQ